MSILMPVLYLNKSYCKPMHFVMLAKKLSSKSGPPPPPPAGLCCMSGCSNCVWIQHAQNLIEYYKHSGKAKESILQLIDKEVEDQSLKAYLKFEINLLLKKS